MRNQRGFSLFEVMVAVGSLAVIAYSVVTVFDIRSQSLVKVHFSYILSDVLVMNVNEVKTKAFNLLPTDGNCLVRHYKLDQAENFAFDSEVTVATTAQACGQDPALPRVIDIFWKVRGAPDVQNEVTFNPADFLKLPTTKSSIVEVEIRGRMLSTGSSPSEQSLSTVIYRK